MENLPSEGKDAYDLAAVKQALKLAYEISDNYVTTQTSYCNEGSCAVSVTVHCDRQGKASITSGNVGDSRCLKLAVEGRGEKQIEKHRIFIQRPPSGGCTPQGAACRDIPSQPISFSIPGTLIARR